MRAAGLGTDSHTRAVGHNPEHQQRNEPSGQTGDWCRAEHDQLACEHATISRLPGAPSRVRVHLRWRPVPSPASSWGRC